MEPEATPEHKIIMQISDTHITGGSDLHGVVDTLDTLAGVLDEIERALDRPDLLLFSGDIADTGDPEAYRRIRATVEPVAERMGVPVLYLPGNHDERLAFRRDLLGWDENDEVIDQVLWCDGLRVIGLDSTVPGSHYGHLDDVQLAWLTAELARPAPLGTVLALHHPPIFGPSEFLNELTLREPEVLGSVIAGSDVSMIVAGHAHHVSGGALAGVPVWVATATAYQMDVLVAPTALRGVVGTAFTRLDVWPGSTVATLIPVFAPATTVYEIDVEKLRSFVSRGGEVTAEEIEAAFASSHAQ
jgi:3',5'-cyclic AMP phosphodiesterase CpdA